MRAATRLVVPTTLLSLALAGCSGGGNESTVEVSPGLTPDGTTSVTPAGFRADAVPDVVGTVASGLDTPWGLAFLPDGRAVVTERNTARVLVVTPPEPGSDSEGEVDEAGRVEGVVARGESGLLGVAVSPDYDTDHLIYLYLSTKTDNRVVRAELTEDGLGEVEPILTKIPTGPTHDGGRLAFGPDGYLYVTTGEAGDAQLARDRKSLAGKILRITADGEPAPDNPFDTAVWSWGHRNVEGIAFDDDGRLWASEFGDDIADELNLIEPGEDYGWPIVEGADGPKKYAAPALTWSPETASPSGLAASGSYLWMASLRGERLWRIKLTDGTAADPVAYFNTAKDSDYGRLRTVALAPDGRLWLTTSNTDGRGDPRKGDDRILLIEP